MRMLSPARGAAASAVTIALTIAAFAIGPAATASPSASSASPPNPASLRPGTPLKGVSGSATASGTYGAYSTAVEANNWAGFAVTRGTTTFRYISASFYVPRVNCTGTTVDTYSGHWVGLDGFATNTVEQTGIEADCISGAPAYSAWWEMAPNPPSYPALTIHGGDRITASVYYNTSTRKFQLVLTNDSTGKGFTRTASCPSGISCRRTSAEAISEPPFDTSTNEFTPLTDFQAATFANVAITNTTGTHKGGISSSYWTNYRITQVADGGETDASGNAIPAGTIMDKPTSLISGKTFNNYWIPEP